MPEPKNPKGQRKQMVWDPEALAAALLSQPITGDRVRKFWRHVRDDQHLEDVLAYIPAEHHDTIRAAVLGQVR